MSRVKRESLFSVYVGHLAPDVTKSDVFQLFSKCGKIEDYVLMQPKAGKIHQFGFVRYGRVQDVVQAIKELNGWHLKSQKIIVDVGRDTAEKIRKHESGSTVIAVNHGDRPNLPMESHLDSFKSMNRVKEACTVVNSEANSYSSVVKVSRIITELDKSKSSALVKPPKPARPRAVLNYKDSCYASGSFKTKDTSTKSTNVMKALFSLLDSAMQPKSPACNKNNNTKKSPSKKRSPSTPEPKPVPNRPSPASPNYNRPSPVGPNTNLGDGLLPTPGLLPSPPLICIHPLPPRSALNTKYQDSSSIVQRLYNPASPLVKQTNPAQTYSDPGENKFENSKKALSTVSADDSSLHSNKVTALEEKSVSKLNHTEPKQGDTRDSAPPKFAVGRFKPIAESTPDEKAPVKSVAPDWDDGGWPSIDQEEDWSDPVVPSATHDEKLASALFCQILSSCHSLGGEGVATAPSNTESSSETPCANLPATKSCDALSDSKTPRPNHHPVRICDAISDNDVSSTNQHSTTCDATFDKFKADRRQDTHCSDQALSETKALNPQPTSSMSSMVRGSRLAKLARNVHSSSALRSFPRVFVSPFNKSYSSEGSLSPELSSSSSSFSS